MGLETPKSIVQLGSITCLAQTPEGAVVFTLIVLLSSFWPMMVRPMSQVAERLGSRASNLKVTG